MNVHLNEFFLILIIEGSWCNCVRIQDSGQGMDDVGSFYYTKKVYHYV